VLMGYGTGAIMAVPGQDQRDWDFAEAFGLPIVRTVQPAEGWDGDAYTGDGPAINSANADISLNGIGVAEAKQAITEWLAGRGEAHYRRETNTMPQWAGSCWYPIRYLDPENDQRFVDADVERYWMGKDPSRPNDPGGVDLYVGGVEHAVLHLLYARFWHKVLYDLGHVSSEEPFRRLFNQGYIQAYAYTDE